MPDGTYRQFDASEEIADAWKRLTNGKATDEDLLLFNHELTELRFVEEGFSVDAAHILSSVDYNWSSVSKIDDFAKKCSEIYGKDFYFGAGTSNEAIDAIVKQIDNLDGQVDDLIDIGKNSTIDYDLIIKYVNDVESKTGIKLSNNQIDELKNALRNRKYTKLTPRETIIHRNEFNKVKNKLISEWEVKTGQQWPRYTSDVISPTTGKVVRRAGDYYDAHHIIENSYGGEHTWWNIHPAKFPNEHQAGIHGVNSPASQLFQ